MKIKNKEIGDGCPTYIIAEMSANHGGELSRAIKILQAAKNCGADCLKVQVYTPDTMTIDSDKIFFQIEKGTWKNQNLYDLYKIAHTPWEWLSILKQEADRINIDFLATPFDMTAVDHLEKIGIDFYKIASQELTDIPLIKYVASMNKPMIVSTGMGTIKEISKAVDTITSQSRSGLSLLKCSSAYPAPVEGMNLKTIVDMKTRFNVPIGLSDHTLGSISAITAVALGASIIEKHFCLDKAFESVDSSFSMDPEELKRMIEDIRLTEKALGIVSYDLTVEEEYSRNFRRSIFAVKDISKGTRLTQDNIRIIRPAYGLAPENLEALIGKTAKKDIERGTPINWDLIL
ncbi:pseudaminic acid synthase [Acetobacterium malicum]|uniref:pseudaminic acid synthase n=1 Tax=Acetobacterium malicum TaxID=52692 RepID=UPI00359493B0